MNKLYEWNIFKRKVFQAKKTPDGVILMQLAWFQVFR